MGLFDGHSSSYHGNTHSNNHRSYSYSAARSSHSPSRSHYTRPTYARSSSSFFGGHAGSNFGGSRGIFGGSGGSSYYKRRPRDGYIQYLMHRLQRMIKELWYYARRHPVKAFFAVVVPLLSAGGAIGGLLKQFGVRLPGGLASAFGGGETRRYSGGYYGSSGYGSRGDMGGGGWMGSAGSLMQVARAFM